MPATSQVRHIVIKVDTEGDKTLQRMSGELGKVNKSLSSMTSTMDRVKTAFISFGAYLGVREMMNMSDSVQLLRDRLKILTGSTESAANVFTKLQGIASETKTGVADLATVYLRLANSTKSTGVSTEQLLEVTKTLQNTFRLSGATTAEATAVAVQLSQGLASAGLRGQELRSVLEQNTVLGDLLEKIFKATRGELYKLAEQGKLTSGKILRGMLEYSQGINIEAKNIAVTFGSSITMALDKLSVKLEDINKKFGLATGFGKALEAITNHIEGILAVVTVLAGSAALVKIASFFKFLYAAFVALTPYGKALSILIAISSTLAIVYSDKLIPAFISFQEYVQDTWLSLQKLFWSLMAVKAAAQFDISSGNEYLGHIKAITEAQNELANARKKAASPVREWVDLKREEDRSSPFNTSNIKDQAGKADGDKLGKYFALNQEFKKGKMSVEQYAEAFAHLEVTLRSAEFDKGKKSLFQLNKEMREDSLVEYNKELQKSQITMAEYNRLVEENNLQEMNEKVAQGTMNLIEYNKELAKMEGKLGPRGAITLGAQSYIESIGTVAQGIADATENAFKGLEDGMVEFIKKGSQDWKAFAQGILDDLARIIVRAQIVKPLANAVLDWMNPVNEGAGSPAPTGKSTVGYQMYAATGGIVGSPTTFMAAGKVGLMGESGPEAIMPLGRTSDGSLGIKASSQPVVVNIINNSGAEVSSRETSGANGERVLEVMIESKVRSGIASGSFDRALGQSFGLSRKGV